MNANQRRQAKLALGLGLHVPEDRSVKTTLQVEDKLVEKAVLARGEDRRLLVEQIAGLWIELRSGSLWEDAKGRAERMVCERARRVAHP